MNKIISFVHPKQLITFFLLVVTAINLFAQEVIPDFYRDPGINPNRHFVNQSFNEHIDPFTGALQQHYVDLHSPGNGGFDLKVVRSYNSASVEPNNPASFESIAGVGWTIHFGRVLKSNDTNFCANPFISIAKNPVLELPDGSRQILATSPSSSALLVTTQRWKADCIASGLAVFAPDGTRYEMTKFSTISGGAFPVYALYTTKIIDKNGNYANISYSSGVNAQISTVTTNDGRTISFSYADDGLASSRISSITSAGQTYSYGYQAITSVTGKYYLTTVSRPDGTQWNYNYNTNLGTNAGSYVMNRATYPQGGYINYGYAFVAFDSQSNPNVRTSVVSSKSMSTGGSWQFNYSPGATGSLDATSVTSPAGLTIYKHVGPNYSSAGTVWMVGLLMSKTIGNSQSETYTWDKQSISNQNNLRLGQFITKVDVGAVYVPLLANKTIIRDGATYSTTYSNFDSYGNPSVVAESGIFGGDRTTNFSYYVDPTKWIINQVKNEMHSGGTILRSFDNNGNLNSITRDGVTSNYTYDTQGNITSVILPRGLFHSYSNYKRGIAQFETQPDAVSISRTVSDAGNVTSETNGDGYTTTYGYDNLNRVTTVAYPVGNGVSILYGASSKVAQRGSLQELTTYDGFGRTVSVTLGGIVRTFAVDVLGRKTFESNPGANIGTSYSYDILDRIKSVVNSDGTSRSISYGSGTKAVLNERGATTGYAYRAYGNPDQQFLMSIAAPVDAASVLITRNSKDMVTAVSQNGLARGYGYNANYYLTAVTNPETGTTTYGRDAAGNMTSRSVGASGTTNYTYDGQNRLTSVVYPGATPSVTNAYNKTNRLLSTSSSDATRNYSYDGNGNLSNETLVVDAKNFAINYAYNGNDQLSSVAYPTFGSIITYSPDVLGRPTQVSGYVTNVSYWPSGQMKQITYANGTVTNYGQNSRLWPSSFNTQKGTSYSNSNYTYDGTGNIININDSIDPFYSRIFQYDSIDRLTSMNGPWGSGSINYTGGGNIASQIFGGIGLSYSYDGTNRLSSVSGSRSASYGYDGYGNIVSGGGKTYTYDGASNLRCINCANPSSSVQYQYDGTNQRVSSTKAGAKTYEVTDSQGKQLISESTQGSITDLTEYFYLGNKRITQKQTLGYRSTTSPFALSTLTAVLGGNQKITLTATISGPNPTGTVVFYNGAVVLGVAPVVNGQAVLDTGLASIDGLNISASYTDIFSVITKIVYTPPSLEWLPAVLKLLTE